MLISDWTAPEASLRDFYVSALNSTAVGALWSLPIATLQNPFNGRLRGFKITAVTLNGTVRIIDIPDNTTRTYTITNLEPNTQYSFSILMYTVADGPEGIHLTVVMPGSGKYINKVPFF